MWQETENRFLTSRCRDRLYIPTAKTKPTQTYENVENCRFAESRNRATAWRMIPCDLFLSACLVRMSGSVRIQHCQWWACIIIGVEIIEQPGSPTDTKVGHPRADSRRYVALAPFPTLIQAPLHTSFSTTTVSLHAVAPTKRHCSDIPVILILRIISRMAV